MAFPVRLKAVVQAYPPENFLLATEISRTQAVRLSNHVNGPSYKLAENSRERPSTYLYR